MLIIKDELLQLKDESYKEFHSNLLPTVDPDTIIGIRTPVLRKYVKELKKRYTLEELETFMNDLPHTYIEENNVHGLLLESIKDYDLFLHHLKQFLPYINNWATCDFINPKVIKKHPEFIDEIKQMLKSKETYTVRFGIGALMGFYLEKEFKEEYLEWVCNIHSDEYYIKMMQAWFFQTALVKQYGATIHYYDDLLLEKWVLRKAISKCVDSFRINDDVKEHLKELRRKI